MDQRVHDWNCSSEALDRDPPPPVFPRTTYLYISMRHLSQSRVARQVELVYIYSGNRQTGGLLPAPTTNDKTQRMPHAQSDHAMSYLTKLTAMIKGRVLDTGCGFRSHIKFNDTQGYNRSSPAWENGAHVGARLQVCDRAHHSSDAGGGETAP